MIIEAFPLDHYTVTEPEPSRIDVDYTHMVPVSIRCPHCDDPSPFLQSGCSQRCPCGLSMKRADHTLVCTLDEQDDDNKETDK